jgi:hypothetical protein
MHTEQAAQSVKDALPSSTGEAKGKAEEIKGKAS